MRMQKFLLLAILFFFVSDVCIAENRPGATTFTLAAAYYHFSSARNLKNASLPNIALAYNFNERWAIEGGVGVINTNQRTTDQGVHGFLYTIDGLYRFKPHQHFEPYVLAGIGILGLKPNGNSNEHQGNINAGIGAQFFADKSIALRAELRDVYTMSGGKNDWMANIGVSYLFDGETPESPVVEKTSLKDENPEAK